MGGASLICQSCTCLNQSKGFVLCSKAEILVRIGVLMLACCSSAPFFSSFSPSAPPLHSRSSSSSSSLAGVGLPKHHLPPSPHINSLPPSTPALPLSIANLSTSHYSLPPTSAHRHPAMFATPATLPPPPTLPTNGLVVPGHPTGTAYPGRKPRVGARQSGTCSSAVLSQFKKQATFTI